MPGADDSSDTSDINGVCLFNNLLLIFFLKFSFLIFKQYSQIDEAGGAYDEPVPMSAVKKLTKEEQKQVCFFALSINFVIFN